MLGEVVGRLNHFVRKTVDAKPYLSGYVVAVDIPGNRVGAVEIRISDTDFLEYPDVGVRLLTREEVDFTYDELYDNRLPPSVIKPEIVSALEESADESRAPVFRVQVNVVERGFIVSVYLHHCISDGTGAGLLILGSVLEDGFTFNRHLDGGDHDIPSLSMRLDVFARLMSHVRSELSWSDPNQISDRQLKHKKVPLASHMNDIDRPVGRGIVFAIPLARLADLKERLEAYGGGGPENPPTRNDILMTLVWHSMTKARLPSLSAADQHTTTSKLNIPVDIRKRLKKHLSESHSGAVVDFASAELPLCHLVDSSVARMVDTAFIIRKAILGVNEEYIRQAIALAMYSKPNIDVRDLQGSIMDRSNAADMYITSWEKLKLYDATFEMGLGRPDWVREPWKGNVRARRPASEERVHVNQA
ncbi:hypothetical protein LTR23_011244 [Exophiala sp. CCFEE 6169]|nr:hypothetical protein LTR23_011244 [Chaetothyriales sp. CCFEE 6169]